MKIQLKRSNVLENGVAKQPTPAQMEYGELAVNFASGDPSVFLKDSDDNIVKFSGSGSGSEGAIGYWTRSGDVLSPLNDDSVTIGGASTIQLNKDGTGFFSGDIQSTGLKFNSTNDQQGIFKDGNDVQLNAGGANRITVLEGGYVGINAPTPEVQLHVDSGDTTSARFVTSEASSLIAFKSSGTTTNTSVQVGASGNEAVIFAGGQERLRVDNAGNVGIGTNNPSELLEVDGSAKFNTDIKHGSHTYTFPAASGELGIMCEVAAAAPANPVDGMMWYNTGNGRLYVYNDSATPDQWVDASPDFISTNQAFTINKNSVDSNYELPVDFNASSAGPVEIKDGVEVIIPDNQTWVVL